MTKRRQLLTGAVGMLAGLSTAHEVNAKLELGLPFRDNMVLQQRKPLRIWGRAEPGTEISVEFDDIEQQATADKGGDWRIQLPPLRASNQGRTLTVSADGTPSVKLKNVLVGEVWLFSGQSNMAMGVKGTAQAKIDGPENAISSAEYPNIRFFSSPPRSKRGFEWQAATPDTVGDFSAVSYYFARALHRDTNLPVGIIVCARGGTMLQSWVSNQALANHPTFKTSILEAWNRTATPEALAELMGDEWTQELEQVDGDPTEAVRTIMGFSGQKPSINFELSRMAEIAPYTIRGFSWYQGESNAWGFDIAQRYREELQMLVDDWRTHWRDEALPFLIVQLPHYPVEERPEKPGEITPWSIVMEAQWNIQKDRPAVFTVVTADLGTPGDIHPKRKAPIGERLSRLARERILGSDVAGTSPAMKSMAVKDETVEIALNYVYNGLETREVKHTPASKDKLEGFLIAGADRYFVRADARIRGKNTVVCRSEDVTNPVAVRYAMHADTLFNLYNSAGLPATPFRTDDWDVDTPPHKQRTVRATKIKAPPAIDGTITKNETRQASDPIEGLEVFHTYRPADPQTRARFTWTAQGLHVVLECPQSMDSMRAKAKKRDKESIWTDDNVQLLLDANHDKRTYIRIVVNPAGTVADGKGFNDWQAKGRLLHQGLLPYYRNFDLEADLDFESAVSRSDSGWTVELTIPWSTLDIQAPPRGGQKMGVQITRTHAATDERSEWATTGRDYNTGAMMPLSWVKGQRLHHGVGRFGILTLGQ